MRRKIVYTATAAAVIAMVAGFALAAITLNNATQTGGGTYVNASGQVTGLTYTSTLLTATSNPAPATSTGTGAAPQALVSGANAVCANTCTAGDLAEVTTYTFAASATTSIMITMTVTASAGGGSTVLYLKAPSAVATLVITWDLGTASGGATITSVTLTDQGCTGAGGSCP